jgi:hypothetical protein
MPVTDLSYLYQLPASFVSDLTGKITIFLHIPLVNNRQAWSLYKYHNIPVSVEGSNHSIAIEPEASFIAMSEDKDGFLILTEDQLRQCQQVPGMYLCGNLAYEYRNEEAYCLSALWKHNQEAVNKVCRPYIVPAKVVIEQVNPTQYYVFHPYMQRLIQTCNGVSEKPLEWRGSQLVTIKRGCSATGPGYKLAPTLAVTLNFSVRVTHTTWKIKQLTGNLPPPILNILLPQAPRHKVSLENLIDEYHKLMVTAGVFPWHISLAGGFMSTIIIVGSILFICLCFRRRLIIAVSTLVTGKSPDKPPGERVTYRRANIDPQHPDHDAIELLPPGDASAPPSYPSRSRANSFSQPYRRVTDMARNIGRSAERNIQQLSQMVRRRSGEVAPADFPTSINGDVTVHLPEGAVLNTGYGR